MLMATLSLQVYLCVCVCVLLECVCVFMYEACVYKSCVLYPNQNIMWALDITSNGLAVS